MDKFDHIKETRKLYYINNRERMLQYSKQYYDNKKRLILNRSTHVKVITYNNCCNKKLLLIRFD